MEDRRTCPNCGSTVESLPFCGVCGRPLPTAESEADPSIRGRLDRLTTLARRRVWATIVVAAALLVFLLLLGDAPGGALLIALLVTPALLLLYLNRLDLYEREPWPLMAATVGAGALLGLLAGALSSLVFDRLWFEEARLNLGAIGFAGVAANGEGNAPFLVSLINGMLIPVVIGAAVLAGPILLRRLAVFRNEILDGMTLGALSAAGFVTVSAFVYVWPGVVGDLPVRPVSGWTAILAGILVVRPLVLILAGALLGIAAWHYTATRDYRPVLIAGIGGLFGWLSLPLGSLILTPAGSGAELAWYLVTLAVVGYVFRLALSDGLSRDRAVLAGADGEQHVVCPNCHRVTPDGAFCSFCRAPLHDEPARALEGGRSDGTGRPVADPATPGPAAGGAGVAAAAPATATSGDAVTAPDASGSGDRPSGGADDDVFRAHGGSDEPEFASPDGTERDDDRRVPQAVEPDDDPDDHLSWLPDEPDGADPDDEIAPAAPAPTQAGDGPTSPIELEPADSDRAEAPAAPVADPVAAVGYPADPDAGFAPEPDGVRGGDVSPEPSLGSAATVPGSGDGGEWPRSPLRFAPSPDSARRGSTGPTWFSPSASSSTDQDRPAEATDASGATEPDEPTAGDLILLDPPSDRYAVGDDSLDYPDDTVRHGLDSESATDETARVRDGHDEPEREAEASAPGGAIRWTSSADDDALLPDEPIVLGLDGQDAPDTQPADDDPAPVPGVERRPVDEEPSSRISRWRQMTRPRDPEGGDRR